MNQLFESFKNPKVMSDEELSDLVKKRPRQLKAAPCFADLVTVSERARAELNDRYIAIEDRAGLIDWLNNQVRPEYKRRQKLKKKAAKQAAKTTP